MQIVLIILLALIVFIGSSPSMASSDHEIQIKAQLGVGKKALQKKAYSKSEKIFRNALEQCRKYSLQRMEFGALNFLIEALTEERKFGKAEKCCEDEIKFMEDASYNPDSVMEAYSIFGLLLVDEKKYKQAQSIIDKAVLIGEKSKCSSSSRTGPMLVLGNLLDAESDYTSAVAAFQKALEFERQDPSDPEWLPTIAICMRELVLTYRHIGADDKIEELYKDFMSLCSNYKGNYPGIAHTLSNFGDWLESKRRFEEALSVYKEAFNMFRESKDTSTYAHACRASYAKTLRLVGRPEEAEEIELAR